MFIIVIIPPKRGNKIRRSHKILNLQNKSELIKYNDQGVARTRIGFRLGVPRFTVNTISKAKVRVLEEIKNNTPVHTEVSRADYFCLMALKVQ